MALEQAITCCMSPFLEGIIGPNPSPSRGAPFKVHYHPREPKLVYPCGKYVVVKNLEDPSQSFVYRGHNHTVTVAKFSRNGYWIASGDIAGRIRVWAWDNEEHLLKVEVPICSGEVRDLDWGMESKRIVAVGSGGGEMAKVFMYDTGNTIGDITGHNAQINSVAYKPSRPFRIMTGGDDFKNCFYAGPPFKFDHSVTNHSNYVNCVRYANDGSRVVSVGSDREIFVYEGKTGEEEGRVESGENHTGSIYSVAFSPDSTRFATCSADKTIKVWDAATRELVATLVTHEGDALLKDMKPGCTWTADGLHVVSLNGDIHTFSEDLSSFSTLSGHTKPITSLHRDPRTGSFYTAGNDGVVIGWEFQGERQYTPKRFVNHEFDREADSPAHGGVAVGAVVLPHSGLLLSAGWDDTVRIASLETGEYLGDSHPTSSQPTSVNASEQFAVVTTHDSIMVFDGPELVQSIPVDYKPTACAIFGNEEIAVGDERGVLRIYSMSGDEVHVGEGMHRGEITVLAYSPDGEHLGAGDTNRDVVVWRRGTWDTAVRGRWNYHTTRVLCLAWSPNGRRLASGSTDENIYVWDMDNLRNKDNIVFAHKDGVSGLAFIDDTHFISSGSDACIHFWNLSA